MLSSRLSFVALIASFASLSACAIPYSESDDPERTGDDAQAIKGGSLATDYPESVLLLMKVGGAAKSLCSGSMLAPNIVLTAGHCVHGFDSWTVTAPFANGQTSSSSNAVTYDWNSDGDNVDPNSHDVALVILDTPINLASYPTVAASELADGSKVVNVGRINNGQLSNTALYRSKPLAVKSAVSAGYPFDYMADEVIEHGDSGGPVFIPGSHTIVAVNSGGGGGTEILARVDLLHDWIVQKIDSNGGSGSGSGSGGGQGGSDPGTGSGGGGGSDPGEPDGPGSPGGPGGNHCPGLPPFGYCYGNTLLVCQNSSVKAISCPSLGRFCGFDYAHGHYGCL
jgi:hypothetical protein